MADLFDGKVALVTGGAAGVRRAAGILFARHGAKVTVADMVRAAGEKVVDEIVSAGGEAIYVDCDVTDHDAIRAMVAETMRHFGRLDCAFNNAGITHPKDNEWDDGA